MTTLITGATGFLGRSIVKHCISNNKNDLLLLGHSEKRSDEVRRNFGLEVYIGDIKDRYFIENLIIKNNIEQIIHCAAIKYVTISNENPTATIETNVIGSHNIISLATKYGIREVVGISTDKAINPTNIYGMTKKLMEEIFIEAGYTIVSGVNFFGSTGSVLDVWYQQLKNKSNLTVTDKSCVRYFVDVDDIADLALNSFGINDIINCKKVYRIELGDLLAAFCEKFDYYSIEETGLYKGEKLEEEIAHEIQIINSDESTVKEMIDKWSQERFN